MTGADAHRRPIAARGWGPSRRAAAWLVVRGASPDAISLGGMVAGLLAGAAFALTVELPAAARPLWVAGALLVGIRLLANMLDGMVAVGRGIASPVGELYNEVPDRISDSAVLAGVGWAAGDLALGLAAALAAMATAYVRATARAAGAPSDFSGPMAKQQRMAAIVVLAAWCALAPAGWGAAPAGGLAVPWWVLATVTLLSLATALRRLMRAAAALRR